MSEKENLARLRNSVEDDPHCGCVQAETIDAIIERQDEFDPAKQVAIIDPSTGAPTGATMTFADIYVAVYSAYLAEAQARDAAAAPA